VIKKIFLILFLITICYLLFFYKTPPAPTSPLTPTPSLKPNPTETPVSKISLKSGTFRYNYRQINKNEILTLIPNFDKQLDSDQIIKNNNCLFGINGGFYLPENKPLGLFEINSTKLGKYSSSLTFNGFLRQSSDNHLTILDYDTLLNLSSSSNFVLQSGPLYKLNQSPKTNFADTKAARRHLIAEDSEGNMFIFSIFGTESNYDGPTLNEIYEFFENPQIKKITNFTVALNLDGGSASAFYDQNQNIHVREIKPLGSFLCGR
jgi:uncharacterized protein YigE (DUF2233 family)